MRAWAIASSSALAVALAFGGAGTGRAQPGHSAEDDSAPLVAEGRAALTRRDYRAAARALDEAIRLNPRRLEAYVLRAAVHAARGEHAAGAALMQRAAALAPDDIDVMTALGSALVRAGDARAGVPVLEAVVARAPQRYDAQLVLGEHRRRTGDWPAAIAALEAYLAARPAGLAGEDAVHQIDLGDAYLRDRQPTRALALFSAAGAARPDDLRARLGAAWATAAIDCARARPLLAELAAVAPDVPEVWLVDGRCALALRDADAAIALGRRYLAAKPARPAAGHALIGEAEAAAGDLATARAELRAAHQLEPSTRRWVVRLAHVERRAGAPAAALRELDALGPPAAPALDPVWWTEIGEALVAQGDAAGAVRRLAPVAADLATYPPASLIYGEALARDGQTTAALAPLEAALVPAPGGIAGHRRGAANDRAATARARRWLAYVLGDLGTRALAAGDATAADAHLTRAVAVAPTPALWRNLGIARLATGGDAVTPLEHAVADDTAASWALLGRARAGVDPDGARVAFDKALARARGAELVALAIDAASAEVAAGAPAEAVAALERAAGQRGVASDLAARHRAALATARHAAGLAALQAGQAERAVELLAAAASDGADRATACDLAIASVVAGDREPALRRLRAVADAPCPFPAPADTQAVPVLIAFVEGRQQGRAARALSRLAAIDARATGAMRQLVAVAIRVVALEAADAAYRAGKLGQAKRLLATAKAARTRAGADELAVNLAVVDLAEGRVAAAIAALEKSKLPEALVNLGVAYDREGLGPRALDAWRRARKAGARFAALAGWIASKEQIYGAGTP